MAPEQIQFCTEACQLCAQACDRCVGACLEQIGIPGYSRCLVLAMECAAVCRLTASSLARAGPSFETLCETCAKLCDACAQECSAYAGLPPAECIDACRRCSQECRRLAGPALSDMNPP